MLINNYNSRSISEYLNLFSPDKLKQKLYVYKLELAKVVILKDTSKIAYLELFCAEIEKQLELKQRN